jgi:hypothetical protein
MRVLASASLAAFEEMPLTDKEAQAALVGRMRAVISAKDAGQEAAIARVVACAEKCEGRLPLPQASA